VTAAAEPCAAVANGLAVLTPWLVPADLAGRKAANLGDGFILRAIERLLGPFAAARTGSPRAAPSAAGFAALEQAPCVVLAGANQLRDDWSVWPGLTAGRLRASRLRLVPFAIGLHGDPRCNERMSEPTRELLLGMHERIECSSWRCPRTIDWLRRELPQLAPQLVMTGCPVVYDRPLLDGAPFAAGERRVAVTVTERGDFWARETAVLDFAARRFPRAQRFLVLHQNWSPPTRLELLRHRFWPADAARLDDYQRLRQYAVRRGFKVVCPRDPDEGRAFYDSVDLHVGSRLHAHLLCLSRARRSWLVRVDGRADGIADSLGFPLCLPDEIERELEGALAFDFERVRERARTDFAAMQRFVGTLPR
jgi:hypothetical protein